MAFSNRFSCVNAVRLACSGIVRGVLTGAGALWAVPAFASSGDPGLLLLADGIEPTARDIYGAAWFVMVPFFLALWLLGAELVVRMLSAFSGRDKAVLAGIAGAGTAIGASYNPSGNGDQKGNAASGALLGVLVFGIFLLALFLLSKRFVTYPLAVLFFMSSYAAASERTSYQMAVEAARDDPEMILPLEQVSLATNPALVGSSSSSRPPPLRVALRVHNDSPHDLVQLKATCRFFLRNGDVAHRDQLTFPLPYRLPSGYGARVESSRTASRRYDPEDYANRVRCEIDSGHLRSVQSAGAEGADALTVKAISERDQTVTVGNMTGRGISSLTLQCLGTAVTGLRSNERSLGVNHAGWIRYDGFRREFRREGEAMIRPHTEETLQYSDRSEDYTGDSGHRLRPVRNPQRCDITNVRWHSGT